MSRKHPKAKPIENGGNVTATVTYPGMDINVYAGDWDGEKIGHQAGQYTGDADQRRMIAQDQQVASCMQTRKSSLLSVPFDVVASPDAPDGLREECAAMLDAIEDRYEFLAAMLDHAVLFGCSVGEVTWDVVNGKIAPVDLIVRPRNWFKFGPDGKMYLCRGQNMKPEYLDEDGQYWGCYLTMSFNAANNDRSGRGLDRVLWYSVWGIAENLKYWLIHNDKYAMPTLWAKVPGDDSRRTAALAKLQGWASQGAVVTDPETELQFLAANNRNSADMYGELMRILEARISKVILGQTMTSGDVAETGSGSYASAKVGAGVMESIVRGDARMVDNLLTKLVRWYIELNHGADVARTITVRHNFESERVSMRDRSLIWQSIAFAGLNFDTSLAAFRKEMNMPEPAGPDDVLRLAKTTGGGGFNRPQSDGEKPEDETETEEGEEEDAA